MKYKFLFGITFIFFFIACKKEEQKKVDIFFISNYSKFYYKNSIQSQLDLGYPYDYTYKKLIVKNNKYYFLIYPNYSGQGHSPYMLLKMDEKNLNQYNVYDKKYKIDPDILGTNKYSEITDMFIYNDDFYLIGFSGFEFNDIDFYTINDSINILWDGHDNIVTSIFANEDGVYVSGMDELGAKYWKNGISYRLPSNSPYADANKIFVNNKDIYVVGADFHESYYYAVYWKNGERIKLSDSNSYAKSIAFDGNDIYIGGIETSNKFSKIVIWKNGLATYFEPEGQNQRLHDILIHNGELFTSGWNYTDGTLPQKPAFYYRNDKKYKLEGINGPINCFQVR